MSYQTYHRKEKALSQVFVTILSDKIIDIPEKIFSINI